MEPSAPLPASSAPTPPATSLPARLLNVFAVPGDVFAEVKTTEVIHANWLTPAVLLVVVGWLGAFLIFSQPAILQQLNEVTDKAMQKQIEKGKMSKEQAEQMRKFAGLGPKIGAVAAPVFVAFVTPFWWGLIVWLVGAKLFKGSFPFMKAVEVAGLSNTISVLEAVVKTLLMLGLGNVFASPTPAMFLKEFDPQNWVHSLLTLANPMTLWFLAVVAIGLARMSGVSFAKAAVFVVGIWATYTGLFWGFGAAMQAIFNR
jgi:hypothetical protein